MAPSKALPPGFGLGLVWKYERGFLFLLLQEFALLENQNGGRGEYFDVGPTIHIARKTSTFLRFFT